MGALEIAMNWASRHGYEVVHEPDDEPNLIIIGEKHGMYACGHVPEFLKAQMELIRKVRPTDVAIEKVDEEGPYPMDTDFGKMHEYFMSSTVVDLYKMVSGFEQKGKLENNRLRRKIAGLIFNWPENLYRREAERIGAEVHLIDNEELHYEQEERAEKVGCMDFKGMLIAGIRSSLMEAYLARLQRTRPLALVVMGSAHMEDIIEYGYMRNDSVTREFLPHLPKNDPRFNIDQARMIAIDQGEYHGPGTEENSRALGKLLLKSIADMLEVEKDKDKFWQL